jgi:general secretion pathway protein E/type IV pilus assembly protein PilB
MLEDERQEFHILEEVSAEDRDLVEQAQEATVVKLVNEILREAINDRASDIHIEPYEDDLRIRYRIDGVLHTTVMPPQIKRFQAAIISRIKIMSALNIAEKRLPQDGAMKIRHEGREIDIRVSVLPSVYGEGIVLRILDKSSVLLRLTDIGMDELTYDRFRTLITRPHGIILVTGPTGSGKTTTLYSALNTIVSDQIKVITVEDPVEYRLKGVNQIQVHPNIGLTFAAGLRSILRHDPDVIMIGEIRDLETAEAAIQASLTGHLVFSTLHTNDACSAATRLIDMGVEPYLVASAVEGVMAQRLVRSICPNCREPYQPSKEELPSDFEYDGGVLYHGVGCRTCKNSGLKGRLGIFELALLSDEMRHAIMERQSTGTLAKIAKGEGMRVLRDDGWEKVRKGMTTFDEVQRVTVTGGI